ncbi:asparagine synthase (glutamine-hydrolyzing) [Microvirga rosea]|uniref:asparagine synthase (glutamine-hydrolyzing) n=1 Tax=Microvirga rosea TaxID=2715425 RepID=UPI001D0ACCD8|nr:asparagine synthase (glutamine-hydrolyzing) [Microvirga rosea]MCB8820154.1 asparagine synthase (glutamine-hydrolyzing) [Microvirga rosea]
MCGIWFSIGGAPDPKFIDVVAHRGPDGRGWQVFESPAGPVALGHRRLSIIDVSDAGLQPMADATGRYHLIFNGEIYNYVEIKAELESNGVRFHSHSDSEVLLQAYIQWGEECLNRFLGMFAFAIWDARDKILFAARDRFGIKPLYFHNGRDIAGFGSEIKQVLELPGLERRLNLARTYDYLYSGLTDHASDTMFLGVDHVRPGECLTLDLQTWRPGQSLPIRRWYRLPESGSLRMSEGEAAQRFRELFESAVQIHLRSDVKIGSCLSGGLDSSAIVAQIDRELAGTDVRLNTVSACFDDRAVDERPFIDTVVRATNAISHKTFPNYADVLDAAAKITWHQDEPYGSSSIFAQWCVFQEAHSQGIKVMLDGQGADEILGGYHGSFFYHFRGLAREGRYGELLRGMIERRIYNGVGFADQIKLLDWPRNAARLLRARAKPASAPPTIDWLGSDVWGSELRRISPFDALVAREGLPQVNSIGSLCLASMTSNLPMLLHWEDRNSMAHSIEARVPFLDHRLVEFCIGIGDQHKIKGGETKRVMRRALGDVLPPQIAKRRDKIGFAAPEQTWYRGPLREAMLAGVEETLSRFGPLFDATETRRLAREMLDGTRPVDFTIWRIVNLGIWGKTFGLAA